MQSRGRVTRQEAPVLIWFYILAVIAALTLFIVGTWSYRALSAEKQADQPISDYTACLIDMIARVDDLKSDPHKIALQVEPLCDEAHFAAKLALARDWKADEREEYMAEQSKHGMGMTILLIQSNRRAKH